jgi:hypothetical protein
VNYVDQVVGLFSTHVSGRAIIDFAKLTEMRTYKPGDIRFVCISLAGYGVHLGQKGARGLPI